ncbi:MAG: transporter associated domain-containing protein, partial [Blastocatellia bacterium]
GHLPAVGEEIIFRGLRFEVIEADERRVSRVRIQKPAWASGEEAKVAEASTAARAETKRNFMF